MTQPRPPISGHIQGRHTVGIVSNAAFAREALLQRLGAEPDLRPVDLGSGHDAVARAQAEDPDLILIDLGPRDACALSETLLDAVPGTRPVAVHRGSDPEQLVRLAEAGFVGFVSADCSYADLLRELRGVLRQDSNCSPQLAGAIIRALRKKTETPANTTGDHLATLSPREREVARLLEQRYSNKEIAAELGIEFGTVKNHVHSVLSKLGLQHRWELSRPRSGEDPPRSV